MTSLLLQELRAYLAPPTAEELAPTMAYGMSEFDLRHPQSHKEDVGMLVRIGKRLEQEAETITPQDYQEVKALLARVLSGDPWRRNRKLGVAEIDMLKDLDNPGLHKAHGIWHPHCGWVRRTSTTTMQLLEKLRIRGLVEHDAKMAIENGVPYNRTYRVTPLGESTIAKLKEKGWKA